MVAACPSCEARYRVDVTRLPAEGARLRCARCDNVFRVLPPVVAPVPAPLLRADDGNTRPASPVSPSPAKEAPQRAPSTPPAPASPSPEVAPPPSDAERARLVLVAHSDVEEAKRISDALSVWGLDVALAHDGVEAILSIQRSLPRLVVLDAALPKMFGFQVCELVKRNESLKGIAVVLMGAIHQESRYRRTPGELYGADAYLERQEIPDGLRPLLRSLGLDRRQPEAAPAPPVSSVQPVAAQPPVVPATTRTREREAQAPPSTPPPPVSEPSPAPPVKVPDPPAPSSAPPPERATAERLARIIVSDIVLYNAERFDAAVRQGEVVQAMANELAEGRELLAQRVGDASLVAGLLENELVRVARGRGMA